MGGKLFFPKKVSPHKFFQNKNKKLAGEPFFEFLGVVCFIVVYVLKHTFFIALPVGFCEEYGGGDGDVEALDHTAHGYIDFAIDVCGEFWCDAAVFVAHNYGGGLCEVPQARWSCVVCAGCC